MTQPPERVRTSRVLRTLTVLAAAAASVATFGGTTGWELHARETDNGSEVLSASSATFTDVFRARGTGIGRTYVLFDGAVELTPSAPLTTPAEVRVRFTPTEPAGALMEEATVFVTNGTVFTAVGGDARCDADPMNICAVQGTLEVTVVNAAALAANTINLHWVATATVEGRGPSAPADATIAITQP